MRSRFFFRALSALAGLGLLTSAALAQNSSGVKIIRGPALLEAASYEAETDPADQISQRLAAAWNSPDGSPPAEPSYEWDDAGVESCSTGGCGAADCFGTCDECCDPCWMPHGIAAGVEATYLKPSFQDSSSLFGSANYFETNAAPRVWLWGQGVGGWGLRGRYWTYDASAYRDLALSETGFAFAQSLYDELDLYAVDLEVTRRIQWGRTEAWASFGARNGRLRRRVQQHVSAFDMAGGGSDDASAILLDTEHDLNGTGITWALDMRRPLGDSRLALICNLRGSVIWGHNEIGQLLTVIETVPVGAGDLDLNDFSSLETNNSNTLGMWIGEVQAGGEWSVPIDRAYGGGNAIMRILFEGQWWNLPGVTGNSNFETGDQWYQFVGLTAMAGWVR